MPYRDYLGRQSNQEVRISEAESLASGLAVGRLDVWPPESTWGQDVIALIEASGLDVVIVRAGAEAMNLAAALDTEIYKSWQADTLLYFKITAESLAAGCEPDALVSMAPGEEADADTLVGRIFADYRNHYSTNPALSGINVVAAYQDWTRVVLGMDGRAVFKSLGTSGAPVGLCVTDISDESFDEILLAGIVPEERGHGAYPQMMKAVGARAQAANKDSVVISTQASNVGVMRAWCRLGFLPTITLNTIHVVRRDIFRAALGNK